MIKCSLSFIAGVMLMCLFQINKPNNWNTLRKWLYKELKYYRKDSLDYKLMKQVIDKMEELEGNSND